MPSFLLLGVEKFTLEINPSICEYLDSMAMDQVLVHIYIYIYNGYNMYIHVLEHSMHICTCMYDTWCPSLQPTS